MPLSAVRVARGLLLFGERIDAGLNRQRLLKLVDVKNNSFRDAADELGATSTPGVHFFDSSEGTLRFGPGAGLVLGVSVGTGSLRAALVDANGRLHHPKRLEPANGQLALKPTDLLDRIQAVVAEVLAASFDDSGLLVDGALPFLGISVAWAVPVDRDNRALGASLHPSWLDGSSMRERVAQHLNIKRERSHALNDAHASAIGVAWHQTRHPDHQDQRHPRMGIVMRLAGTISAASIVVESPERVRHPERAQKLGPTSGFVASVLLGGRDLHAGELGHLSLDQALIDERNASLPDGLGRLTAYSCSCTTPGESVPDHLEAYGSATALAHRVAPTEPKCDVVDRIITTPDVEIHRRALEDVGVLVGHALRGPVLMLDPATITLTGTLAVPTVQKAVSEYLLANKPFGNQPDVQIMERETNRLIRVQGAALAILRAQVHRKLEELVGGQKREVTPHVRDLTVPLHTFPWDS